MAIDLDVHGNTKPLEAAVQAAVNRIRRQPIKITIDDKGATQPLGNMKRGADEFTKSMEAANARILAFGASMAIINGVGNAFKGMVKNLVEVEKSLADINVVMGLSAQNLEKFGDGLFKVAKETGAAFKIAADAATEYARQGLGVEESLKRTRDALVLTRLTGMDSAEAVKSLTAAMNTYGTQIKDTTQLVSKFAAVDVKFAVSAQDFADAISRTGQSAKSAGVSIDELVGIVTAAQQQTARGGAVIGNALKTIFTKTGRTDTLNQLENLGVAVRDLEGNTVGAKRILTDLANTFDTLSEAQKAQITQTMGGLFHINILKAVLSDAAKQNGIMAEATRISAGATDEAIQKNEELRKTLSAVATETGLAIKQVSSQIGEIALAPGMEKILNTVKSLAEGLSGVLGDGEGMGNKFATGLLKGIGNVITGPGLVVLASVFFKLFGQALKFTKESLTSLVGVTTEKQKQKAIQTSLVALFGQNAALNKEMLRTDIGRTEKEKIILGLLKAQVVEANALNKLTAGMAGTLYRKGYGANLTPVGKKASGHIPNFANPERAQAAQGGYAAGSIRTMNMPGEGPVIYNSAETVKNFAGFKQPAIMPPQSSKAGKNYQQAFGDIHGFDPYAAGGYVPNFAGPRTYLNQGSSKYIGLTASYGKERRGTLYAKAGKGISNVFSTPGKNYKNAGGKSTGAKIDYEFYSLDDSDKRKYYQTNVEDELKQGLQKASYSLMNGLLKTLSSSDQSFIAKQADLDKDLPLGKMGVAAGHIFEGAAKTILRTIGAESAIPDSETARIDFLHNKELYELFGVKGAKGSSGAEAKINSSLENSKSFARKIYDLEMQAKGPVTTFSKTSALGGILTKKGDDIYVAGEKFNNLSSDQANTLKRAGISPIGRGMGSGFTYSQLRSQFKSYGHIPNFADPLSDAIGREKAAGVPVSQIRVGSHGALMNKSNPLGLGVTNTKDEPNGLRDVFGANGFVPNYAEGENFLEKVGGFFGSSTSIQRANEAAEKLTKEQEELAKSVKDNRSEREKARDQVQKLRKEMQKEENLLKQNHKIMKDRNSSGKQRQKAAKAYLQSEQKLKTTNDQFNQARNQLKSAHQQLNATERKLRTSSTRLDSARKTAAAREARGGGMGGMGLMMGLPLLTGFVGGDDPTSKVGGALSGAMMGAATGASIGMMLPGFGTAIGVTIGGLYGLYSGLKDAQQAAEEKAVADRKAAEVAARVADMNLAASLAQAFRGKSAGSSIGNLSTSLNTQTMAARTLNIGQSQLEPFTARTTYIDAFKAIQSAEEEEQKRIDKNIQMMRSEVDKSTSSDNVIFSKEQREQLEKGMKEAESTKPGVASGAKREIIASMFGGKENEFFASPEFDKLFGSIEVSGEKILEKVKSFESDPDGVKKLDALFDTLYEILKKEIVERNQLNKAVILRLNKERDLLNAQDRFNKEMNTSAETYAEANNKLDFIFATQASTMSEMEKAGMIYAKALMNAAEKYKNITSKAEEDMSVELYNKLTSGEYKGEFIKHMEGVEKERPGKFLEMSREEQERIARRVSMQLPEGADAASSPKYQMDQFLDNQVKSYDIIEEKAGSTLKIEESRAKSAKDTADALYLQQTGPGSFSRGMEKGFSDMRKQTEKMDYILGAQIPQNFANGLATAMSEGLSGAKDIGDALNDAAVNFLNMISQAMMQKTANNIVGMLPFFSRGGNVRKYSQGGGVPAMVSNGEYVMGRDAVAKYGGSFMHGLNAGGKIPAYSNGGFAAGVVPTSNQYKSGKAYQSMPMSGFFYSQSGNVGLQEDAELLRNALSEKSSEEQRRKQAMLQKIAEMNQKEEERVARKEAKRKAIFGAITSVATSFLTAGLTSGLSGMFGKGASGMLGKMGASKFLSGGAGSAMMKLPDSKFNFNAVSDLGSSSAFRQFGSSYGDNSFFNTSIPNYRFESRGGKIPKYANGGHISGKSGIDQIPAMLSEGEYVIRASSARQIGKPMLDRINAGKFNDGGAVDNIMQSSETSGSSDNTNNINISINIEGGSVQASDTNTSASTGSNTGENQGKESYHRMADKIKEQVLGVIMEEQRPGGLLY